MWKLHRARCLVGLLAIIALMAMPAAVEGARALDVKQLERLFPEAKKPSPLEARLFADAADGTLREFTMLKASLVASGVRQLPDLRRYEIKIQRALEEIRIRRNPNLKEKLLAKQILKYLHEKVFTGGYHRHATEVVGTMDHGKFNCVSSALLFSYFASELGLKVRRVEVPGHVYCELEIDAQPVVIEPTCKEWFRVLDNPKKQAEMLRRTTGISQAARRRGRRLSDVQLVAVIYYNRGVEQFHLKNYPAAITANLNALRLDPRSTTARSNLWAAVNNGALALCRGEQFAEAADLLARGQQADPAKKDFQTNDLHVHQKWVAALCRDQRYVQAMKVLDAAHERSPRERYFDAARFDVCRLQAVELFADDQLDRGFAALDVGRDRYGDRKGMIAAEANAINQVAIALAKANRHEEAIALYDRGLIRRADQKLLVENRRAILMQWARAAFDREDYAEAIRRTSYGANGAKLHTSLSNNLEFGYHRWLEQLTEQGDLKQAAEVLREADTALPNWNMRDHWQNRIDR